MARLLTPDRQGLTIKIQRCMCLLSWSNHLAVFKQACVGSWAPLVLAVSLCACAGAQDRRDADFDALRGDLQEVVEGQKAQVQLIESLRDRLALVEDKLEASALHSRVPARLPVVKVDPPPRVVPRAEPSPITIRQADLDAMGGPTRGPTRAPRRGPVPPPDNVSRADNIGVKPLRSVHRRRPIEVARRPDAQRHTHDEPIPAFKAARKFFKRGDHASALPLFTRFLRLWPEHEFADNALLHLGQIRFDRAEFSAALELFQRIVNSHPTGNKMPDALLMMGLTFDRMGLTQRGETTLSRLMTMYPQTEAGRRAALELENRKMRR